MRSGIPTPGQTEPPASSSAGHRMENAAGGSETDALVRRVAELTAENAALAEAVKARDGFLAVAAHELRNALTPVVARVDLLRNRMAAWPPEKIESNLAQIEQATGMFTRRATTLLDVARLTSGRLQLDQVRVNAGTVAQAIVESFRPLAERARAKLKLDRPELGPFIKGDRLALEQILDNLISNAIKYGAGTPITVRAGTDALRGGVRFSVSDRGPGISPEAQARIFERFERAVRPGGETAGFGVGLWVVKQLCEAMGGAVEVSSAPGAGSTFRITLPLYPTKDPE